MNIVDLIIIVIFTGFVYDGWRRGFIRISIEIIFGLIAIALAFITMRPMGDVIVGFNENLGTFRSVIGFVVSWLIFQSIISFAYTLLGRNFLYKTDHNTVNRVAGVFMSSIKVFVGLVIFFALATAIPSKAFYISYINDSSFNKSITNLKSPISEKFSEIISRSIIPEVARLATNESIIGESDDLGFQNIEGEVDTATEQQMFNLVNQERINRGLNPLSWNEKAAEVARKHSRDMFMKGYFSHTNKDGLSPFDRMNAGGIDYNLAGENLAYAPTVATAHEGLMNSLKHKENILHPKFNTVGIGVISSKNYGMMFTQNFTD